jgi:hypothetical protein
MAKRPLPLSLLLGGVGSVLIALLHVAIVLAGPRAYRFFGAGQLLPLLERGSWIPALVTLGLAAIFGLWGLYAFSGAGLVRKLPFLHLSLWLVGGIYTLRGLLLMQELALLAQGRRVPTQMPAFSAVALSLGIAYLAGAIGRTRDGRNPAHPGLSPR